MTAHTGGAAQRQAAPGPAGPAVRCAGLRYQLRHTTWRWTGSTCRSRPGETFGLLGPNGAGQDDHHPDADHAAEADEGTVTVFGVDAAAQPMLVRRMIGYVPQLLSADASLTGRENVELFARLFDVPRRVRGQRVDEALAAMGLDDAAERLVKTYSGGMIRRLELAQALVNAPRLLVLDEPTVGLDPIARADVWEFIAGLRAADADDRADDHPLHGRGRPVLRPGRADAPRHASGPPAPRPSSRPGWATGATLDDVFRHYTGGTLDDDTEQGGIRDVRRARRTARRLG